MQPVRVTTEVPDLREEVYDFLDVMANHEPFTNHILRDWRYAGPDRGVGSKATVTVKAGGRTDTVEIEVVSAERPATIVERNIGARGRRVATGTYTLEPLPSGGTKISFEYAWQLAPLSERLAASLVRAVLHRAHERAMERLAEQLAARRNGADGG
jgi:carbon monoxide dehydrogenase subunit G